MGARLGERSLLFAALSTRGANALDGQCSAVTTHNKPPPLAAEQGALFDAPNAPQLHWAPELSAAQDRLTAFLPYVGDAYAHKRNYDLGPQNRSNVSGLSPWISHRLLLESDVLTAVLELHSPQQARKFIEEVFWRGYFKGWLEHRPEVWRRYTQAVAEHSARLERDAELMRRYQQAIAGDTGISCFDAWVHELRDWGYLHNHARMWFASVWIMTLRLPWELGADFFFRHLLDGDAASNTCSWRWVAGLHTQGKTYLARPDNIETYTQGRFVAKALAPQLASSAPALQEPPLPPPRLSAMPGTRQPGQRAGVVITADDVSLHQLPIERDGAATVVAGLALVNFTPRSALPSPALVSNFAENAVRAGARAFAAATRVPVRESDALDWGRALTDWVREHSLDEVVVAHHATGPVNTRLQLAAQQAGVTLSGVARSYDALVWPAARAGYFGLRKKIPNLLQGLSSGRRL